MTKGFDKTRLGSSLEKNFSASAQRNRSRPSPDAVAPRTKFRYMAALYAPSIVTQPQ